VNSQEIESLFNSVKTLQAQCSSQIEDKLKALTEFSKDLSKELNKQEKPEVKIENPVVVNKVKQVNTGKSHVSLATSKVIWVNK